MLPRWSVLSDSFPDGRVDALSWADGISEVAALLAFGAAGAYVLRRRPRQGDGNTVMQDGAVGSPSGVR